MVNNKAKRRDEMLKYDVHTPDLCAKSWPQLLMTAGRAVRAVEHYLRTVQQHMSKYAHLQIYTVHQFLTNIGLAHLQFMLPDIKTHQPWEVQYCHWKHSSHPGLVCLSRFCTCSCDNRNAWAPVTRGSVSHAVSSM